MSHSEILYMEVHTGNMDNWSTLYPLLDIVSLLHDHTTSWFSTISREESHVWEVRVLLT